ncbi:MAG: cytochrome c oxidase subunit 3 [Thermoplasmatota archaeon]
MSHPAAAQRDGVEQAKSAAAGAHHREYSKWPLVLGIGLLLTYLGLGMTIIPLIALGAVVFISAIIGWVHEDGLAWPAEARGEQPMWRGRGNGWWGAIFFLCTEVMLFGALFAMYFSSRARNGDLFTKTASEHLNVFATGINTIILLASGVTMHYAQVGIRNNDHAKLKWLTLITIILGGIFLALQVKEYSGLISEGITPNFHDAGVYGGAFFMLTGTHGFHVFVGLCFLLVILVRAFMGHFSKERHVAVEAAAIYWHFVDVVWVFLYVVVYLRWF